MATPSDELEPGSIAIVGMAGRFPAARSPGELWTLLREGREATRWLTPDELREAGVGEDDIADPDYVRASLVLPDMEMFDAGFFGFSKRDAAVLDPQHRHFMECAWEALEDAGHMPENFSGAIGVFGGCGMQAYLPYNLLSNPALVKSMGLFLLRHTGNDKDFLCSRVSYLLDLKGPSLSIQTACSTSLVAVHVAAQSLLSGECDMALAGGTSIELPHRRGYRYAQGEILSPDGHCRAFDDDAAGTLFGSGAGIVVLRRLEDAIRDRDNIHAVIRGSAVNNDGSQKAGYLAPSVDGQARAAVEALAVAGVEPASVAYIEAHGTGTPVGDPIELAALAQAYGGGGPGFCGIGSLKTNIGHLDTAAGVASLIKVCLALRHGLIPASLNFSRANSRIDMAATPFQVVAQARPWPRASAPRRAAVNSLGVGGTNAHVIVEEAPAAAGAETADGQWQVLTLSARSAASLARLKAKWLDHLADAPPDFALADAAFTTQVGRRAFDQRCAIVARNADDLRAVLQAKTHARCVSAQAAAAAPGVVLMFPGGGAHYPGAGRELLGQPAFAQTVDECFRLMPAEAPADLRRVMFEADATDAEAAALLERPTYALPALFTLEYALGKLWESWGIRPAAVIGHSAGEYAAACLAGVMSLADALAIVALRGQLFEQAPAGGMVSVDLPHDELLAAIAGLELDIAAVNAPDLCIASGALPAIAQLEQRLAAQGVEARRLHITVAAHSRLLDGLLEAFRERLSRMQFHPPSIRFISNLSGSWADGDALATPDYWVRHLRQPVRFSDGLRVLQEMPDAILLEAGPGQGLCALARQNRTGQPRTILASTCKAQEPNADLALMLASAGALWARGERPDWQAMRGASRPRRISLPTYAFDHERHWVDALAQTHQAAESPAVVHVEPVHKAAVERLASLDDWFCTPEWTRAPLPPARPQAGLGWLVFGDASALTTSIAAGAVQDGGRVTLVRAGETFARDADGSFTMAPADEEHHRRLLEALEQDGALPGHILHLWALGTLPGIQGARLAGQTLAFDSLLALGKAIQAQDLEQEIRLTVVTAGSQSVASEAVPHPERALALGPCRVIPRELPHVSARLVDLASVDTAPDAIARAILHEATHPDSFDLTAWRDGERWSPLLTSAPPPPPDALERVREGGTYLITGGLGDIALDLAGWLASTRKACLALVSRRAMPPRESWLGLAASGDHSPEVRLVRRLLALEAQGGQVLALAADVGNRDDMARVVSDCRARFGAINGVFHAAGALDDGLIATKTADSVQRVMQPKACGAQVLHELLPPGDLDVFAVFSSTSVYLGAPGQVDYVAANAFLGALAAARPDGLAIHWGVWGDKGMASRAWRRGSLGHDLPKGAHPLLGAQVDSDNGAAFEAAYDPRELWVLKEHAVGGRPVLPGTAYIELARAAMNVLHPGAAVEIRALSFEEAMVFDGASRRLVRTELRHDGGSYDFVVRSRGEFDDDWLEHARAGVGVFVGTLESAATPDSGEWPAGEIPQERAVAFGARWHNIARMRLSTHGALAEFELPRQFADDLAVYGAHPALTDMAATFGLHLVDAADRKDKLFVPLSIARIRLVAPVPAKVVSRVELKGPLQERFAAFDVRLHTPDGAPVATFEGFSLRGVLPAAVSQQVKPHREPSLSEAMLSCGIREEDSPALFTRILRGTGRHVVVSSIDLSQLGRAIADASPKPPRKTAGAVAPAGAGELNPVEQAIAQVWRDLLGVDDIATTDDFFALGGHSLAAVRLFARIRKQFAVDLPLATLFETPTLGELAALVARVGGVETARPAADSRKAVSNVIPLPRAWSPLVTICRGRDQRLPLFCVHGAGGNVLNFKVISDRLGPDLPFYGLQAQGVDGRLPPLSSIEDMAAQYLEPLRAVQPRGPYRLAGYSAGGVIALEMAQRLQQDGHHIEFLGMIDTLSPVAARHPVSLARKVWLMRHWSLKFALGWPERRRRHREMVAAYQLAVEKVARGEQLPPELVEFHLFRNFVAAQARYQPARYDGSIALFRASTSDSQYLASGRTLGWEHSIRGEIRVTRIAGSHLSMMAEPGVSQLIEALRKELAVLDGYPDTPQSQVA